MTDVAKTIQFRFTPLAALLATTLLAPPLKAQTSSVPPFGTINHEVQEQEKIEVDEEIGWIDRESERLRDRAQAEKDSNSGKHTNKESTELTAPPPLSLRDASVPISEFPLAQIPGLNPGGNPIPALPPPQDIVPPAPPPTTAPSLPQQLPSPQQLLQPTPTPTTPEVPDGGNQNTITVQKFEFSGNTAFSNEELAEVTQSFIHSVDNITNK